MEACVFTAPENDEGEEGDVWSDLETLKKLYGVLDKSAGINTESNNEEMLDNKSRMFLMKLLDEATQHTLRRQMKMLPGSLVTPQLVNTSSIQRLERRHEESIDQKLNNSLRYSVQRRDSNLLKSQFSTKSRQSQAHHAPTQPPSHFYHPMSQYHGRSGIDRSSKHPVGGSSMYRYHKEKSIYCPSEHHSSSNGYKTAELTQKRIRVSPKDQTNLTPGRVRLNRVPSRSKQMNRQGAPYKINQSMRPKKNSSTDGTTSSSESNNKMLDHRKTGKLDKWAPRHKMLPAPIDRRKKQGDRLLANTTGRSNSVTSCDSSNTSTEYSSPRSKLSSRSPSREFKGPLPIVPFRKPSHHLATTHSRKPLNSLHEHSVPLQRIRSSRHKSVSSRKNPRGPSKTSRQIRTPEQKKGRFKRLKDKLAIVLHLRHDHHHYHHHQDEGGDGSRKGGANKDHRHRSLWKYLKGALHHSSERSAEIVPSRHDHQHRHMRVLFRALFSHLWGNKKRKKARLGRTVSRVRVKKLHWWQKMRGGKVKLTNGKKARLKLRYDKN